MSNNCTEQAIHIQADSSAHPPKGWIAVPSGLTGFQQTAFDWELRIAAFMRGEKGNITAREIPPDLMQEVLPQIESEPHWVVTQCIHGEVVEDSEQDRLCPHCGHPMAVHSRPEIRLHHLPSGHMRTVINVKRFRYVCPNDNCPGHGKTVLPALPFQAAGHRITTALYNYIVGLYELGYTQTRISELTGVDRHIIRVIDKARLVMLYTEVRDGKVVLKQPEEQAVVLGIDEFKLHNGHEYATYHNGHGHGPYTVGPAQ